MRLLFLSPCILLPVTNEAARDKTGLEINQTGRERVQENPTLISQRYEF